MLAAKRINPPSRGEPLIVFGATFVALLVYALRAGTYDIVAGGEAAAVVWWVVLLGVGAGLFPRTQPPVAAWVVFSGFAALCVWTVASFGWTESDERTSVELARDLHHLGWAALVFCTLNRRTAPWAIAGATAAAVVISALGVASRLWPAAFPEDVVSASFGGSRLSYPFNYWNAVAAWGAMGTAMTFAWGVHASAAIWRAVTAAALPICVAAVYLSYSRAGAAGLALGAIIVVLTAKARSVAALQLLVAGAASLAVILAIRSADGIAAASGTSGRGTVMAVLLAAMGLCALTAAGLRRMNADERLRVPHRIGRPAAAAAAVVLAVVAVIFLAPVVRDSIDEFRGVATQRIATADPASRLTNLNGTRSSIWRSALDAFESHSLRGTGPGTFEFWWNRGATESVTLRDAHSLFLEALAEMGWPGFLAVLLVCGGGLAAGILARKRSTSPLEAGAAVAALAGFAVWMFHAGVDWMWEETAVTVLALTLSAAACAAIATERTRAPLRIRVPAVAMCAVAILVQLPPLVGTSRVRSSQRAFIAGDLQSARASAQDAVDAWPWASTPLVQRALISEAAGEPAIAEVDALRAARREKTNWRHPLLLSRLAAEQHKTAMAVDYFRRARLLKPKGEVFVRTNPQP